MSVYDCIVLGGGPAGLSVAATLQDAGVKTLVIERKHAGYNVSRFPICMKFFSSRSLVELNDFSLTIPEEKPTREQYLAYLHYFVQGKKIALMDYVNVESLEKKEGIFEIRTKSHLGKKQTLYSKTAVVAVGALDHPQKLQVEGEDLPHVTPYFQEVYPYIGRSVLVVGSGNGAVETALMLFRAGARPALSYRKPSLDEKRIKYWMYPDISKRLQKGQVEDLGNTTVEKITKEKVILRFEDGKTMEKEFDFVIIQTGYEPPIDFLKSMGINIDPQTKIPQHDDKTLESNVPGLFVAGAIVGGNVSGKVFIENSRFHGAQILPRVKQRLEE